ncbi:MAG TPA: LysR family transcriptional regulator [Polyangiaceae bacterium]
MDFRWDDIRLFLALYRERTLSAAGARLGLDGSTMSRRLVAFEESLGHTLFDRSRDGLLPTSTATELLAFAEEMERASKRFEEQAEGLDGAPEGTVKLTMPPFVAESFVVPQLSPLLQRHPGLRFDIDASQRRLDLSRGEADIALRDSAQGPGDVIVTRLLVLEFAVLATPAAAARIGAVEQWETLPWISWGEPVLHLPASAWLREQAPSLEPVLRSTSLAAQIAGVQSGLGVALLPKVLAEGYGLVPLSIAAALEPTTRGWPVDEIWLAASRSRRALPRVAAVWDFLLERAREIAPNDARRSGGSQ